MSDQQTPVERPAPTAAEVAAARWWYLEHAPSLTDEGRDAFSTLSRAVTHGQRALDALRDDARRLDALELMAREPGGVLLHDERAPTFRVGIGLMSWSERPRSLRQAIDDATMSTVPAARVDALESSGAPDVVALERQFTRDAAPLRDARDARDPQPARLDRSAP